MTLQEAEKFIQSSPLSLNKLEFMQTTYMKAKQDGNNDIYDRVSRDLILEGWMLGLTDADNRKRIVSFIFKAHCFRARHGNLESFLIAIEFYKPYEKKFYEPRAKVFEKHGIVKSLQDLLDRKIIGLAISMAPRTGKSEIEKRFIALVMGLNPSGSTFFSSHTNPMANKFYKEICLLIEDPSYCWKDIFPEVSIVERSAEDKYIDVGIKETYKSFYSRGIDGNMAGILEANELLCCDDLVKDSEEARNPERIKTAVIKYAEDIKQRRKNEYVRELHISTRWAVHDVIGRLYEEHANDNRWRFIKVPAINDKGESNFMYDIDPMTVEHFEMIKRSMFMADGSDISFNCIYQQEPADRQGILFPASELNYYDEIPEGAADRVIISVDIAWGGNDYYSAPIGYVYNDTGRSGDVYIDAVVHVNREMATKEKTYVRITSEIINRKVNAVHFEANNGGDAYASEVRRLLAEKDFRCNITDSRVSTARTKNDRIISTIPEIKGINPNGYRFWFKRKQEGEYAVFMRHVTNYNSSPKYINSQPDDAPDALSGMVINLLDGGKRKTETKIYSRQQLGL